MFTRNRASCILLHISSGQSGQRKQLPSRSIVRPQTTETHAQKFLNNLFCLVGTPVTFDSLLHAHQKWLTFCVKFTHVQLSTTVSRAQKNRMLRNPLRSTSPLLGGVGSRDDYYFYFSAIYYRTEGFLLLQDFDRAQIRKWQERTHATHTLRCKVVFLSREFLRTVTKMSPLMVATAEADVGAGFSIICAGGRTLN